MRHRQGEDKGNIRGESLDVINKNKVARRMGRAKERKL